MPTNACQTNILSKDTIINHKPNTAFTSSTEKQYKKYKKTCLVSRHMSYNVVDVSIKLGNISTLVHHTRRKSVNNSNKKVPWFLDVQCSTP